MTPRFTSLATLGLALLAAARSPETIRTGLNALSGLVGRKLDQGHVDDFARYASTAADALALVVPSLRGLAPAPGSAPGSASASASASAEALPGAELPRATLLPNPPAAPTAFADAQAT